jgi:uncharacterized protein YndB with AHSA1/START domain
MTTAPKRGAARAIADVGAGMLLATVDIAAPAERVFRALTSAELLEWWGSADTYRTTRWSGDVRVGGAWSTDGIGADGTPFSVGGEFVEIDPPRKLVQTWRPSWDGSLVTTITYRLQTLADGGTRVTVRHEGFGDRAQSCESHAEGWVRVLGWLSAHCDAAVPLAAGARS